MRRNSLLLSSVFGFALLSGCGSSNTPLNSNGGLPPVARPQKGDVPSAPPPRPRTNILDTVPETGGAAAAGETAARIRATVNGVPIFDEEIQANAYPAYLGTQNMPEPERTNKRREIFKETLDGLVERELLIQDAQLRLKKAGPAVLGKLQDAADKEFDRRYITNLKKQAGLKTDDELQDFLREQGVSLDMVRRQWTRQFLSSEYLRNRVIDKLNKICRADLVEYYETHAEDYKQDDAVDWEDLFIGTSLGKYKNRDEAKKAAETVAQKLAKGDNFLDLCKEYDDGNALAQQGKGIGRKRGEIQPVECEEHLFSMRAGDVGPIIEIPTGFHVFRLVKRDFAGKKPFDEETQKEIQNKLRQEMYDREVKKIVNDLKRKAIIEYSRSAK